MTVPVSVGGRKLCFQYGDEKIAFHRTSRISKNQAVLIKVHPDCKVVVAAPDCESDEMVLAAVKKRQRWIHRQLAEFKDQSECFIPRSYNSGEAHYYLGRQYQLKVLTKKRSSGSIKLIGGKIEVSVQNKDAVLIKKSMHEWYRERAKQVFATRLQSVLNRALWVPALPTIQIRTMKTQWGSCSPTGRILLNLHLVKAPRDCIDYVILHELCHLAEHNHSKRFYKLMSQTMPGWEDTKIRLDGLAFRFLS